MLDNCLNGDRCGLIHLSVIVRSALAKLRIQHLGEILGPRCEDEAVCSNLVGSTAGATTRLWLNQQPNVKL